MKDYFIILNNTFVVDVRYIKAMSLENDSKTHIEYVDGTNQTIDDPSIYYKFLEYLVEKRESEKPIRK